MTQEPPRTAYVIEDGPQWVAYGHYYRIAGHGSTPEEAVVAMGDPICVFRSDRVEEGGFMNGLRAKAMRVGPAAPALRDWELSDADREAIHGAKRSSVRGCVLPEADESIIKRNR